MKFLFDKYLKTISIMSSDESFTISLEEVDQALTDIENKYSPIKVSKSKDGFEEILGVLSKEFDSVGLPTIDLSQTWTKIFKQVVATTRSLIHIHRKTLNQVKDVNIDIRCKSAKSIELCKVIDDYKSEINSCQNKNALLQKKLVKLQNENEELVRKDVLLKKECDRVKRHHTAKQNELLLHIKKLTGETQHMKEILNKGNAISRDESMMKLLKTYRHKEETYKSTIQKLQNNNKELLEEIFTLREEKVLSNISVKKD